MTDSARRWPSWVYSSGDEPDPRFSFANERTLLAWIRTALSFIAAGMALHAFDVVGSQPTETVLSVVLVTTGLLAGVLAWLRWARAERSLRRGAPLPSPAVGVLLVLALALVAAVLVVVITF